MPESSTRYDRYSRRILDIVEMDRRVTQRSLARDMGIALGLTNLLIKRLVRKGWMRVTHISPNRVRYLITPAGIVEKSRMSRDYLEASVQFYREARDRVKQRFLELSTTWPVDVGEQGKRIIVFFGANEVAEIGYVCLAETDLRLVGVVDPDRTGRFFDMMIASRRAARRICLAGQAFDNVDGDVVWRYRGDHPAADAAKHSDDASVLSVGSPVVTSPTPAPWAAPPIVVSSNEAPATVHRFA
jgi:hypothetical protein